MDKKRDRDRSSLSELDQSDPVPPPSKVARGSAVHSVSEINRHTDSPSDARPMYNSHHDADSDRNTEIERDSHHQQHSHSHSDVGDNPRVSPTNENDDDNRNDDAMDDAKQVDDKRATHQMDGHDPDIEPEPEPETDRVNPTGEAEDGMQMGRVDPSIPPDDKDDPLLKYQRAQLAARIHDQNRDMLWLREKVNELQKLVAVLDAAPRAALYHMCAVREDLTMTLVRLGLSSHIDNPSDCPIAATLLDAEIVTNDSLAEMPAALKKLTAQIVLAREKDMSLLGKGASQRVRIKDDYSERHSETINDKAAFSNSKSGSAGASSSRDADDDERMGDAHRDPDNADDYDRKDDEKGVCDGNFNNQSDDSRDRKKPSAKEKRKRKIDDDKDIPASNIKSHVDDDGSSDHRHVKQEQQDWNHDDGVSENERLRAANNELHRRLRVVSDQLERYAERDKQSLVSSTTFKDEYDDLAEESSIQRRKIVSLKTKLEEREEELSRLSRQYDEDRACRDDAQTSVRGMENGPKRSTDSLNQGGTGKGGGMGMASGVGGGNGGIAHGSAAATGGAGDKIGSSGGGGGSGAAALSGNTSLAVTQNGPAGVSGSSAALTTGADVNSGTPGSGAGSGSVGGAAMGNSLSGNASGTGANSAAMDNGGVVHMSMRTLRDVAEKRLHELREAHAQNKKLEQDIEGLRAEIAKRDNSVVPIKTILNSAFYQTMEATLSQLFLKERNWVSERKAQIESYEAERKEAADKLEQTKATAERKMDDLRRQLDDLRRIADAAKIEKDKVMMTYEARKMETGNGATISAAEKRANISDEMRSKLEKVNKDLSDELNSLRLHVRELENRIKDSCPADSTSKAVVERLQAAVENERLKSNAFIQEVESLSTMFSEVDADNKRLVKQLGEKEAMLSRVMAERLRGRQLLTTIKEENRALNNGRELDASKIKQLTSAVAASKKTAQEASASLAKSQEEVRVLSSTLEKRRRIADDATKNLRSVTAENEEMKRERDTIQTRAETAIAQGKDDAFNLRRARERVRGFEDALSQAESTVERLRVEVSQSRIRGEDDMLKDGIIQEMRKRLHCSVVTNEEKAVVLLRCGHLFSRKCTDDLIATRNRKCPICGKPFGNDDVRSVFF